MSDERTETTEAEPAAPSTPGDDADASAAEGEDEPSAEESGDAASGDVTVEELLETFEAVTAERDRHLADLQRTAADFQNFRRQTEKRHQEMNAQAGARVVEALLPVLDACDAAIQQGVEGVEPIATQLRGVLQSCGLEVIDAVGEPFDPSRHEAAMTEEGDEGQEVPVVSQVLRTGYAWNGKVLRAAMVSVKG